MYSLLLIFIEHRLLCKTRNLSSNLDFPQKYYPTNKSNIALNEIKHTTIGNTSGDIGDSQPEVTELTMSLLVPA